jgi:hypothetical protein
MQLRKLSLAALSLAFACPMALAQAPPDLRKAIIEVPLKRTIRSSAATPAPVLEEKVIAIGPDGTQKCVPGKVHWVKNFEQAKSLSATTDRPVLMFAMLGNLDDKFC